jgi:hypothetical protein
MIEFSREKGNHSAGVNWANVNERLFTTDIVAEHN